MKHKTIFIAVLAAIIPISEASAAKPNYDRKFNWPQFIAIVERLKEQNRNKMGVERVTCSSEDGTTIDFTTSGVEGRDLTSTVRVRVDNRTTVLSGSQISNYYNADDRMAFDAFKKSSTEPYVSFRADLAPTERPQVDEVATHSGTVTMTSTGYSATPHKVTCNTFRKGAGVLKPQGVGAGNIQAKCFEGAKRANPLVYFEIADSPSARLVTDLQEVRSPTDSEVLPAFLVSQIRFTKAQIAIELDDGSAQGNLVGKLIATGERVPTGQVDSENPIYGIWSGTYERFDSGRQAYSSVTCYASQSN